MCYHPMMRVDKERQSNLLKVVELRTQTRSSFFCFLNQKKLFINDKKLEKRPGAR